MDVWAKADCLDQVLDLSHRAHAAGDADLVGLCTEALGEAGEPPEDIAAARLVVRSLLDAGDALPA